MKTRDVFNMAAAIALSRSEREEYHRLHNRFFPEGCKFSVIPDDEPDGRRYNELSGRVFQQYWRILDDLGLRVKPRHLTVVK